MNAMQAIDDLEKSVRARAQKIETVTKQLENFAELQAKHTAMKAKLEAVKMLRTLN